MGKVKVKMKTSQDAASNSTQTEQWLTDYGVDWHLRMISLRKIDRTLSKKYQNRLGHNSVDKRAHVDADHVAHLKEWMDDSTHTVPPLVVYVTASGKYAIIDGNHRHSAASSLEITDLPAYVVEDLDAETIKTMTLSANARNAKELSHEERLVLASEMSAITGATIAAKQFQIPYSTLTDAVRYERGRKKIFESLGYYEPGPSKCAAVANLDASQISVLGRKAFGALASEISESARAIRRVDAANQHEQAIRESERLLLLIEQRSKPASGRKRKRGQTLKQLKTSLQKTSESLTLNPDWVTDPDVRKYINTLFLIWTAQPGQSQKQGRSDERAA